MSDVEFAIGVFHRSPRARRRSSRRPRWCPGYGCCRRPRCASAALRGRRRRRRRRSRLALRRAFGEPPASASRALTSAWSTSFFLSPRCGACSSTLRAGTRRQRLGDQRLLGELVAQQNERRRRPVVVELAEKAREHFLDRQLRGHGSGNRRGCPSSVRRGRRTPGRRSAARLMRRDDVGVADAADVDVLVALDLGQRADAVADQRRRLEIERRRTLLRISRGEALLHVLAAAGRKARASSISSA